MVVEELLGKHVRTLVDRCVTVVVGWLVGCLCVAVCLPASWSDQTYTHNPREGSGCAALLASEKFDDLARMYRLLNRVGHPTGGAAGGDEEEEDGGSGVASGGARAHVVCVFVCVLTDSLTECIF